MEAKDLKGGTRTRQFSRTQNRTSGHPTGIVIAGSLEDTISRNLGLACSPYPDPASGERYACGAERGGARQF